MSIKYLFLVAVTGVFACSSGNPPVDVSTPPANSTRKSNFLPAIEMETAHADGGDLYAAISRLRPNWLVSHGVAGKGSGTELPRVFIDGQPYGDPSSLRNIPAYHVSDITYYDVTQAGAIFGIHGGTGGVIDVKMKVSSKR